ncbi:MAG TPA: SCO family protein [Kiritimatiellia bacterium]|nr:SCO family protein [Kiritimatiellia bacterium]HMP35073.1 SCO family protein [Kiritimatiellia bacterium]
MFRSLSILVLLLLATHAASAKPGFTEKPDYSRTIRDVPDAMKRAGFEQRHNAQLPLDTVLRNEKGESITLGSLFDDRPVLLNFVYFNCPMLCNVILNSLCDTLKDVPFTPGVDYQIITVSFDHTEGHELAAAKKANYLEYLGKPEAAAGWHFLTGDEAAIQALTSAAGFTFAWDEQRQEYAHASGIMLATPQGRLSHYFFGVMYEPRDVRLGLVDASAGKIGSPLDRVQLLFCYHYNPAMGTYSFAVFRVLKLGGILTIAALGLFMGLSLAQEKKQRTMQASHA